MPGSFSSIGLDSTRAKLQLLLKSVREEKKVTKARMVTMLKESKEDKISPAGIKTRTERKWNVNQTVCGVQTPPFRHHQNNNPWQIRAMMRDRTR